MKKYFMFLFLLAGVWQQVMAEDVSISNASDLIAFASRVNNGETTLNGILTADIDLTGESFTRIGNRTYKYAGAFDGQGHSVTLDMNITGTSSADKCQGFFGCATIGASFSNLIIKGSVTSKANCTAALVGEIDGNGTVTISKVGCEATVNCTGSYVGAFIGNNSGGKAKIVASNCYNTGIISGSSSVGIMQGYGSGTYTNVYNSYSGRAFGSGTYTNCYTAGSGSGTGLTTEISAESVSSGELCFNLGSAFTQDLENETHPMLFSSYGKRVYRFGSAGSYTYSNDNNVTIGSAGDLIYFAGLVNEGQTTLNGILTADIDLTGKGFTRIGNRTYKYAGAFDGQGHSVTLDMNITGTADSDKCQGLFGCVTGGASISNVIVKGSITCRANCVAALVGETNGSGTVTITNVGCEATVNGTGTYVGAFLGNNSGGNTKVVVTNSYNTGNITSGGVEFSVMGGWCSGTSTYTNVYNTGSVTGPSNATGGKFTRNNNGTCTNCYTTEAGTQAGLTTEISAASITSGELCYKLGSAFRQVLGEGGDAYPVLDTSKPNVYQLTVGNAGYASFVPEVNVAAIPTGVEVYVGENKGSYLHLEKVTEVPADNAFVVKAAEGNYYYNNTDAARSLGGVTNNLTYSPVAFSSDGTQYCLANLTSGVGFYMVKSGTSIPARKVYLSVTTANVKAFYGFDEDDATGIRSMEDGRGQTEDGAIFNLAGQMVSGKSVNGKLPKGINIINGKKILF